ncbi:MAG: hypothetical protein IJ350_07485, partial [Clostridia bacterium]|nr:hypothetical protein [Clostridia bacterium]
HFIIQPIGNSTQAYFQSVLLGIDLLNAEYGIVQNGYSLVYRHPSNATDALPVFHIISGNKLH